MIWKGRRLLEWTVEGIDGPIGTVTDIYFDQDEQTIRYLAVRLSDTILDRISLIGTTVINSVAGQSRTIRVSVSRGQVEQSPEFDINVPVSRQYEAAIHRFYEWPIYWGQTSFIDTERTKNLDNHLIPPEEEEASESGTYDQQEVVDQEDPEAVMLDSMSASEPVDESEPELEFGNADREDRYSTEVRSLSEIVGYRIVADDGEVGTVDDILIDDVSWSLLGVVGNLNAVGKGPKVAIPESMITGYEWSVKQVGVAAGRAELNEAPAVPPEPSVESGYVTELYHYLDAQR